MYTYLEVLTKFMFLCLSLPRNAFADTNEDKVGKCNTEKSKHIQRKNFRTAGKHKN